MRSCVLAATAGVYVKMLREFIDKIKKVNDVEERQDAFLQAWSKRDFASAVVVCIDMQMLKALVNLLGMSPVRTKQPQLMVQAIRAFVGSYRKCTICQKKTPTTCVSCEGDEPKHVHTGCTLDVYPILAIEHGFAVPGAVDAPRCPECAQSAITTILKDVPNIKKKVLKLYFRSILRCDCPDAVCASAIMKHALRLCQPISKATH